MKSFLIFSALFINSYSFATTSLKTCDDKWNCNIQNNIKFDLKSGILSETLFYAATTRTFKPIVNTSSNTFVVNALPAGCDEGIFGLFDAAWFDKKGRESRGIFLNLGEEYSLKIYTLNPSKFEKCDSLEITFPALEYEVVSQMPFYEFPYENTNIVCEGLSSSHPAVIMKDFEMLAPDRIKYVKQTGDSSIEGVAYAGQSTCNEATNNTCYFGSVRFYDYANNVSFEISGGIPLNSRPRPNVRLQLFVDEWPVLGCKWVGSK